MSTKRHPLRVQVVSSLNHVPIGPMTPGDLGHSRIAGHGVPHRIQNSALLVNKGWAHP
jgi:hypothetical protein